MRHSILPLLVFLLCGALKAQVLDTSEHVEDAPLNVVASRSSFAPISFPPAAYWRFETLTSGNALDSSGNGVTMAYTGSGGTPPALVSGKVGNAVRLVRANQNLSNLVPAPTVMNGEATLSFWINVPTGFTDASLLVLKNASPVAAGPRGYLRGGPSTFYISHSPTLGNWFTTPLACNTWHHIAYRYVAAGTTMQVAVNGGAWTVTSTSGVAAGGSTGGLYIGGVTGAPSFGWSDASLDEVAIWNRHLTEAEKNIVRQRGVDGIPLM